MRTLLMNIMFCLCYDAYGRHDGRVGMCTKINHNN